MSLLEHLSLTSRGRTVNSFVYYSITNEQSGTLFTNKGATSVAGFSLPSQPVEGTFYRFCNLSTFGLYIVTKDSSLIFNNDQTSSRSFLGPEGSFVYLQYLSARWNVIRTNLSAEEPGFIAVPGTIPGIAGAAASSFFTEIISAGVTWVAGSSNLGQTGTNTALAFSSPVSVVGSYRFTIGGTKGSYQVAIETGTGRAYTWGSGNLGQLGDNTTNDRSSPTSVMGARSFRFISGAGIATYAVEGSTGTAWAWGIGTTGQLGDNTNLSKSSPVSVMGARSFSQISGGSGDVASALEASTGNAYTWGAAANGGLGNNTITPNVSSPVSVVGARSFSQLKSGDLNSVAIEGSTGNLYTWGTNTLGQLGVNAAGNRSSPVSVVGGRSFRMIYAAQAHNLAIEASTGHAYTWGSGTSGQLGENAAANRSSPVSVFGARSFAAVAAGNLHSIAVEASTGIVFSWGSNSQGVFGDLTTISKSSPVSCAKVFF